ncbi:MAG: SMC family ATPase [Nitrososphaeria archaeon]
MRLANLQLKEFCQFKDINVDLTGNLIALRGQNGVGKTNMIRGIKFGLTGISSTPQDRLVRNFDNDIDDAFVKLTLEADYSLFSITRNIIGKREHQLIVQNQQEVKEFKGAKTIQEVLEANFEMPLSLVEKLIFVDQWEIFEFLVLPPSTRTKLLTKIFDLDKLMKVYDVLTSHYSSSIFKNTAQYSPEKLHDLENEINQLETQIHIHKARLETLMLNYSNVISMSNAIKEILKDYIELSKLKAEFINSLNNIKHYYNSAKNIETEINKLTEELTLRLELKSNFSEERKTELLHQHAQLLEKLNKAKDYEQRRIKINEYNNRLKTIANKLDKIDKALLEYHHQLLRYRTHLSDSNFPETESSIKELLLRTKILKELYQQSVNENICVLCKNSITNLQFLISQIEELDSKFSILEKEIDEFNQISAIKKEITENINRLNIEKQLLTKELNEIAAKTHEIPETDSEAADIQEITSNLQAIQKELISISEAIQEINKLKEKINSKKLIYSHNLKESETHVGIALSLKSRIISIIDNLNNKIQFTAELNGLIENFKNLSISLENLNSISDIASLNEKICDLIDKSYKELVEKLKEAEKLQNDLVILEMKLKNAKTNLESEKTKEKLYKTVIKADEYLSIIKQGFHWKSVQSYLINKIMSDIIAITNSYLNELNVKFHFVKPVNDVETVEFKITHYISGREINVNLLSGGEKVIAALCLRLAMLTLLSEKCSILIMDEPFAGLDEINLNLVMDFLIRLKNKFKNYQLIVVTHEYLSNDVFDKIINLELYDDGVDRFTVLK